jgi:hypothetical protein
MAHADYECCAVCDSKVYYSTDAETKGVLCSECVANMARHGVIVGSVNELIEWMNSEAPGTVFSILQSVGFQKCYYCNAVDSLFDKIAKEAK